MKFLWTIIVLIGFTSVLFGGLFSMAHGSQHGYICLATRLNGSAAPCPEADPIGFASFHNTALKKLSNLILIDAASIIYFTILVIIFLRFLILISVENTFFVELINPLFLLETRNYKLKTRQFAWLALHEKRDPAYLA